VPAEFREVYERWLPVIWRYVRTRIPEHYEAQDITSEIFTRAWRAWSRYDPAMGTARAWLLGIAHHVVADWWRSRRTEGWPLGHRLPEALDSNVSPYPRPDEVVLQEELLAQLQRALTTLSDREREAIALRFAGGLTSAEIGQILGLTEGAVKMMIYRAIMKLQGVMGHDRKGV
jgi:RNA polymerase sigma-70 factor (ECF subfamily)